jgi:hypothetical protein
LILGSHLPCPPPNAAKALLLPRLSVERKGQGADRVEPDKR